MSPQAIPPNQPEQKQQQQLVPKETEIHLENVPPTGPCVSGLCFFVMFFYLFAFVFSVLSMLTYSMSRIRGSRWSHYCSEFVSLDLFSTVHFAAAK